ncbi:CsbD family protein [Aeoliella sp. ICT_H6.2]|uniref:CsbD family protein n=1 Tax=Aeoliella straminimaris TaxID=2954799 RepID=A0A9X2FIR1_9BACT|nr:CsbD family protein [Aeoliella straminimaris]MCO6046291.1 CsbD family protein [Aeoliella straminimaris]
MATQDQIQGGWTELKGKVKEAWGQLNDDELRDFRGNFDQFVGWIQQQTGQTHDEVAKCLADLEQQFRPVLQQVANTAREYYDQAKDSSGEAVDRVKGELQAQHARAEKLVRTRPVESVAVAFGAGLVAGVVVALVLRSK